MRTQLPLSVSSINLDEEINVFFVKLVTNEQEGLKTFYMKYQIFISVLC